MKPAKNAKVIIRHCDSYEPSRIRPIVREAMDAFGLRPRGRTLVKPNLVCAGEMFKHAYTRPEVVDGVLSALKDRDVGDMTELAVGERCAITIPTRFAYEEAGYNSMLRLHGATRYCFDEVQQKEVFLRHEGRLRDSIFIPEPVTRADFFVNCPKFKAHPWTTVTFSLKNYIGIQDDRHRLIDHDHALNRKLLDLQYVIQPELIAIDCIVAGEGRMLTPTPRKMDMLILGNNQVAIDAVASHIIGIDAHDVEHIRFAHEHGFGPIDLRDIDITGDVSLDEAVGRGKGFEVGLIRVEKYFEGTNVTAYAGPPPGHGKDGYCFGGCPGVLEEVIELLRLYDDNTDLKMPKVHLVFGHYEGALDLKYGEKVVFVGDCCQFEGNIGGKPVSVKSLYRDRSTKSPHEAEHQDVYERMLRVTKKVAEFRNKPWVRLTGCPVSVGELMFFLAEIAGLKNPYFDQRQIVGFNMAYALWRSKLAYDRMRGVPYQIAGETVHGEAKPVLDGPSL